ncbi:MAG: NAD(P)-dependent oxidoreductase [Planctomycetaceae bacterium]
MADRLTTGIIGLGLLGSVLAEKLLRHGTDVAGFDTRESQREMLAAAGGTACGSPGDVFEQCGTVFLSLPNSDIVAAVVDEVSPQFASGQIVIDTTTGDPEQMISTGRRLGGFGVRYIEATIAGSSSQLRSGTAVMFLGGSADAIAAASPLLAAVAERRFHLGDAGAASRFKLVHNLVLGLHRAVLAEGLTFGEALGFAPSQVLEILRQTPAASAVMESKGRKMVERDFEAQARLSQHLKDVRLILSEAGKYDAATPLSERHRELLDRAVELGYGDADNSAVIEAFRSRSSERHRLT